MLDPRPAPNFALTDAAMGEALQLSELRGFVVALSFLYTQCPDTCPLTAEHLREAQQALGADSERVVFVAVSVDPEGDTPASVRDFTAAHRLGARWHYLIGSREALAAVWALYGIGAVPTGGRVVSHNDAIYLIDAQGREREIVHADTPVALLVQDLRTLVREGSN
ncbi:MAG: SCO family protein [Solirubrobacteraceae bacterium]